MPLHLSHTGGRKTGILGIGNILLRDEGFGVHCVQKLQEDYLLPPELDVLDGGTAGIMMAPFMESVQTLYVIDTINLPERPGTVRCFSDQDIRAGTIQGMMSPHQVGLLEILSLCRLRDRAPETVELITVVPADLSTGLGLSAELQPCMATVLGLLRERLAGQGIRLRPAPAHA
ncbi:MAG TPA: hydrogenase maturation protease [Desulfobulbus sp.]|nr:hydrogenase maturation protease [Desulfobulbus sp.]